MDTTQIILAVAVGALTVILSLVGYEVFLIFREFHRTLKKFNKVLDDVGTATETVTHQITSFSDFVSSAKTTFELAKMLLKRNEKEGVREVIREVRVERKADREDRDNSEFSEELEATKTEKASPVRRFFHRSGRRVS